MMPRVPILGNEGFAVFPQEDWHLLDSVSFPGRLWPLFPATVTGAKGWWKRRPEAGKVGGGHKWQGVYVTERGYNLECRGMAPN